MAEEKLLQTHTSFYEDCFLLTIKIEVDNEALQLQGTVKCLRLYCPHLNISFTPLNLRAAISQACIEHGVHFVGRMKCGEFPLFEVDFVSNKTLHSFLTAMENRHVQSLIQTYLEQSIDVSTIRPKRSTPPQLDVAVKLYLLNPNVACKDPILRMVTLDNFQDCVSIFRKGQIFDYGALIRFHHEKKCREGIKLIFCFQN